MSDRDLSPSEQPEKNPAPAGEVAQSGKHLHHKSEELSPNSQNVAIVARVCDLGISMAR